MYFSNNLISEFNSIEFICMLQHFRSKGSGDELRRITQGMDHIWTRLEEVLGTRLSELFNLLNTISRTANNTIYSIAIYIGIYTIFIPTQTPFHSIN